MEATYTDPATSRSNGGKFVYWDVFYYHNEYVNKDNLIGSWVGKKVRDTKLGPRIRSVRARVCS